MKKRNQPLVPLAMVAALCLGSTNAPAATAAPAQAKPANKVLVLDGQAGCLEVADCAAFHSISNSITLEAWCLAQSFYPTKGSVNSILRKNVAANAENFFLRIRNTDGPPLVEFGLGAGLTVLRAPVELKTNQWFHLAGTFDGRTVTLYVNGAQVSSQAVLGALKIDTSDLVIGKGDPEYSYGEYFHGMLDEVRIWNVARSAAEIQATLHKPLTGKEKGLVACWNFDNGAASDATGHAKARVESGARIQDAVRPTTTPALKQGAASPGDDADVLTVEKRLAVVEALWRNLSEIYPALEYKGIRGREWIEPCVERVRNATSNAQFYDALLQQMAFLKDTHTRILSYPGKPSLESPPVLLNQVEGKVAVVRAHPVTTLGPGDVIASIDGRPVEACLTEHLQRVCNSTELGRAREACGHLLRGPPGSEVAVEITGSNATRRVVLRREAAPAFWSEPAISHRALSDSIGYIRISHWSDSKIPEEFDRALEKFKDTRGLIIDVRGNGGGNDRLADVVNGRLIKKPVVSSIDFWRNKGSDQYRRAIGWVEPRGPWTYEGRVAVLIDEGSTSACEHFASGIEAMERVLLVGQPTNGAGGGPTGVELPDGTRMAISRALGFRANGVVFEGHGIPPHIYAALTLNDLRSGRDAALEVAREWIVSDKDVPCRAQSL